MEYLITLDVGTTAVKAGLYSEQFSLVSFVIKEYSLLTPQKDYVELAPDTYWDSARCAIRDLIKSSGVNSSSIRTITCTTQGETLIPVDSNGNALHNAIVWIDSRAKQQADLISKEFSALDFYRKTGLPEVNAFSPIAKLLWFKDVLPSIYTKTAKFLLLEDFLIFKLCGRFVTNPGLLCSTGYFDIFSELYWNEILDFCKIDKSKLPDILPCGHIVDNIRGDVAADLGLSCTVKITTGAMDQVSSAIGSGNTHIGALTETTGTCQVVAATCVKKIPQVLSPVSIYSHAIAGKHLKIVISQTAGIAYKWFRNEFCPDLLKLGEEEAFKAMDELAAIEPPLSNGLTMYPHMTGMQFPYNDETVRGVFFGVGLDTNRGCFIRSIMEGVGYMLRESIEIMGITPKCVLSLGGGSKSRLWCQIKSDICGIQFTTLCNEESTSLGAAILGSVAIGLYPNIESAENNVLRKGEFHPNKDNYEKYSMAYSRYLKMHGAFSSLYKAEK